MHPLGYIGLGAPTILVWFLREVAMPHDSFRKISQSLTLLGGLAFALASCSSTNAQTKQVIYRFKGDNRNTYDGFTPYSPLTIGPDGKLYGTTFAGGAGPDYCSDGSGNYPCGSVFQLTPPAEEGLPWEEALIYSFGSEWPDALQPLNAGLIMDASGNIYGTTPFGGTFSDNCGGYWCGTVFQLVAPTGKGGSWARNLIYQFEDAGDFNDGFQPLAGLVFDNKGNLYGTTSGGGIASGYQSGTVYRLSPSAPGSGPWTETVLYNFQGGNGNPDGSFPESNLLVDNKGNLFGTTLSGGTGNCGGQGSGCGTIFELSPPNVNGGAWTETTLYSFQGGSDGNGPNGIILGKDGNFYGTTQGKLDNVCIVSRESSNCGTVFKLSPPNTQGAPWTETTLYRFGGLRGRYPLGDLVSDAEGRLYGTTAYGGNGSDRFYPGSGTIFMLIPQGEGWLGKVIYRFREQGDGANPQAGLAIGKNGELFGTASAGGGVCSAGQDYADCGTVFEITK